MTCARLASFCGSAFSRPLYGARMCAPAVLVGPVGHERERVHEAAASPAMGLARAARRRRGARAGLRTRRWSRESQWGRTAFGRLIPGLMLSSGRSGPVPWPSPPPPAPPPPAPPTGSRSRTRPASAPPHCTANPSRFAGARFDRACVKARSSSRKKIASSPGDGYTANRPYLAACSSDKKSTGMPGNVGAVTRPKEPSDQTGA